MDKSNRIIKFNPPRIPEETQIDRIKEVVDYIVNNAPPEALIDFSKQLLTKEFRDDPDEFQNHYKTYREYMDHRKLGYGQLINFPINKGANRCR
jgi:hypothetical protein